MDFSIRTDQPELLDLPDIPAEAIYRNMQELSFINRWLGGHDITIQGFHQIAGNGRQLTICEIGSGGGDNLRAIEKKSRNQIKKLIGIDINRDCISFAEMQDWQSEVQWIRDDFRNTHFKDPPDILFCSLFCHHFKDEELVSMLQWMYANCTRGFFINDLHRHPLAYYAIRMLTAAFSRSYLVKNDAPLSVRRGFRKKELESLLQRAGISSYHVRWKWAFRWLVTVSKENDRRTPI
jgi:2-polyprenyl-3-methyl-5-hydroxy-6-metoxy-1,4-benzoquinol methylase